MSTEKPNKSNQTTVAISSEALTKLEQFCKANSITKKDFIPIALRFFEQQGINPLKHESPKTEIEKVTKRIDQFFAFFKKQETEIIMKNYDLLHKRIGELEALTRKSHGQLGTGLTQNELWLQQLVRDVQELKR